MRLILAGTTALLAFPPAAAVAQEVPPPTTSQRLQSACREVDQVDRARLTTPSELPAADYHVEARAGRPGPGADALRVIRIVIGYSGPGPTPRDSVWAWQAPDRSWHVSRAHYSESPSGGMQLPWPHDASDLTNLPASRWTITEGRLSPEAASDLEALLGSDCFEREPVVRPRSLPVQGGETWDCLWHPTVVRMEMVEGGRVRRLVRTCDTFRRGARGEPGNVAWVSDLIVDTLARGTLVPASDAARPQQVATIPEAFRGRWGQDREGCPGPHVEISENGFVYENRLHNRLRRATLRAPRTLIVGGDGPGLLHDVPLNSFELPLMLSPDLERLAIPPYAGIPMLYVFRRCR